MRTFAFFVLCFCIYGTSYAQAPQGIPYQSALRNSSGAILANQVVSIRFSIRDSSLTGTIVYQETHGATTNGQGMVALTIGQGTASTGVFSSINWGQHAKFLQVEMDPLGGTAYVDLGTQQLMSVPYALYAVTSGHAQVGPQGATGANGVSVAGSTITNDSLYLILSNGQILNAGYVRGAQGPIGLTGATGPQGLPGINGVNGTNGVSITTTSIVGDSLFITLSNGQTLNAGYVRGPQGIQGIAGNTGATGPQGPAGPQGVAGTFPNGTTAGEMMYWNGTAWVSVAPTTSLPGNQAKTLKFCNGAPTWEDCPAVMPTVSSTISISGITYTTASSGGSISSDGGAAITARGVCWSTSSNPTTALSTKTIDGSGTGSFTSSITGLVAGSTTYYVRAYATNSVGTAYGNEVVFTTAAAPTVIGQSYQGGIVAYILQAGDPGYDANLPHGLIAAPSDQITGIVWGNGAYLTTTSTALGTGNANTNTIVAANGNGTYAAKLCYDLVLNGYSDWYLPSKDELNKLYLNNTAIGGFAGAYYWSSSQYNSIYAWFQTFYDGGQGYGNKSSLAAYVRAVRAF